MGVIDRTTECVFIERNRKTMREIKQMARLTTDFIEPPHFIEAELKQVALGTVMGRPLDFAYLDLCGYIHKEEAEWIAGDLNMEAGAFLGFTTSNVFRSYRFGNKVGRVMEGASKSVLESLLECRAPWFRDIDIKEGRAKARMNSMITTSVIDLSLWPYDYKLVDSVQYKEAGHATTMLSTLIQIEGRQPDERRAKNFYKAVGGKITI